MSTLNQIVRHPRPNHKRPRNICALQKNPQKRGVCMRIYTQTPKKPNSALRKVARVRLSNKEFVTAYVPGVGHNLQQYGIVLVRGGRAKDLPGVRYHLVRGKYDLSRVQNRKQKPFQIWSQKSKKSSFSGSSENQIESW